MGEKWDGMGGNFTKKQSKGWNYWALFLPNSVIDIAQRLSDANKKRKERKKIERKWDGKRARKKEKKVIKKERKMDGCADGMSCDIVKAMSIEWQVIWLAKAKI